VINLDRKLLLIFNSIKVVCFDFDGVFTDNKVYTNEFGQEMICCNRSDGIGISNIKKYGLKIFVISTEKNPVVSNRCSKLNLKCYQSVGDKACKLKEISNELSIPLKNFAFVGNDTNDLGALKVVGLPIAVSDSYPEILHLCTYTTKNKGGNGAVRELCDIFVYAKQTFKLGEEGEF